MYIALKEAGIKAKYEGATYELIPSFNYDKSSYERQANGKGEYKDRGKKKILNIKYTPDFIGSDFFRKNGKNDKILSINYTSTIQTAWL